MPDEREKNPDQTRREERLAAALRENLRRRKAQARARQQSADNRPQEPKSRRDR